MTWRTLRAGDWSVQLRVRGTEPDPGAVYLCPSVGEYPVYDELIYQVIRADQQRNRLFRRAIEAVAPGAAVLEIGPGPDLLWTLVAATAGARRVYAIEVLPDSAREARRTAARHPAAPVEVMTGDATQVTLPERAQAGIAEIVGCLGGAEGLAAVLADAQQPASDRRCPRHPGRGADPGGRGQPGRVAGRAAGPGARPGRPVRPLPGGHLPRRGRPVRRANVPGGRGPGRAAFHHRRPRRPALRPGPGRRPRPPRRPPAAGDHPSRPGRRPAGLDRADRRPRRPGAGQPGRPDQLAPGLHPVRRGPSGGRRGGRRARRRPGPPGHRGRGR